MTLTESVANSAFCVPYSEFLHSAIPLTVFEKYMLFDDSASYPMDSFRFFRFSGKLEVDLFVLSIESVVRFQPLLSAKIRFDSRLGYVWEHVSQPVFVRRITTPISTRIPTPERIDIFNEAGFKVYIVEDSFGCSVLFQFHHTVSDGLGEMDLLADILTDYNDRVNGKVPKENPRNLDFSLLKLRGSSGLTLAKYFRYFIDTAFTTHQLLFCSPSPLVPCKKCDLSVPDPDYYQCISTGLPSESTVNYFSFAKRNNVTINDLLIRDLFLTINKCRQEWGHSCRGVLWRVSMPMSLRTSLHERIPASNNVTMVFLDRRSSACADADKLLRGVGRETRWIKRAEQKHVLILSLRICNLLPGGIGRMLRARECRATAVLSNLGRVFDGLTIPRRKDGCLEIGGAVLEEVDATPPIRLGTLVSISALTYAGKLRLILRYDAKNMNQNQANQFMQTYTNHITTEKNDQ
ncbi:MAG: hypothetical protein LBT09_04220 [Planctomycetaceae bacterium]|jgi:NRPS condensation-like uncharacterized protein|nr:hypothetical protein [Planctomycetaceae bacterium]